MADSGASGGGSSKKQGSSRRGAGRKTKMGKSSHDAGGSQQRRQGEGKEKSFPVVADARFASMHSAPAFQRVKPDERKVQLDDRFKAVLTDPRFQVSDARGAEQQPSSGDHRETA